MMLSVVNDQAPVPPPPYHRAQAKLVSALHIDALSLVTTLHLLTLCRLAMHLAHRCCPPPLPAGPGGALRIYREDSLLLLALLRTLWRLSRRGMYMIGCATGPLLRWPVAYLWARTVVPAFPVLRNSANADNALERRCQKHFLCSVC